MKKLLLLIFIFFSCLLQAQNLVPNPSFEDYSVCPNNYEQIDRADYWSSYRPSPDYYNRCSPNIDVSVPANTNGFQNTSDSICNAFAGIVTYFSWPFREFLGTELISPLVIGEKYFVSFKVSLAEISNCGSNKIGVMLSTMPYNNTNQYQTKNYSQIYDTTIIIDKTNWTEIHGSFIADSTYKYIIIGNFFDDSHTDVIKFNALNCLTYYYIDEICLSKDSLICNSFPNTCGNGISSNEKSKISIFPNPIVDQITIELPTNQKSSIKIYNSIGQLVFRANFSEKNINIDLSSFPEGMYMLQAEQNNWVFNKKVVVIK